MGWTSYHANFYKNGKIDRKAEIENEFNGEKYECLKSALVGTTVYSAVRIKETGEVFGVVTLTSTNMKDYFNFSYKDMDETEGPYYFNCPKSILKLLTPTENQNAMEWRAVCWHRQEQKKAERNNPYSLNNLPIGAVIEFFDGDQVRRLVKHPAAYQFKRPFWMVQGELKYYSVKYIPENYKVITY